MPNSSAFTIRVVALLAILASLFFVNLWAYDVWPPDEPRFAQVAREMMQTGDYIAPHVNAQPYREKPPLHFWAMNAVSWPFGDVTELGARLPSAIAGTVTLVLAYLLALRLFDPRTAIWTVIVLATCSRFWWQARTGQIDMLLTACMTFTLYAFHQWFESRRVPWLVAFYAGITLGLYAKGPPALVFPLLFIFALFWRQPTERRKTHWIIGFSIALALIAAWLIPARMAVAGIGVESVQADLGTGLFRQTIGRFFLGVSHAHWPWYYLETLPVDLFPWTLFLPWVLVSVWARRRDANVRFLLAWIVPAFIFFSICIGKRGLYLLPIFPPMAILMAHSMLELIDSDRATWRKRTALAWAVLPLALVAAPFVIRQTEYADAWVPSFYVLPALGALIVLHALYIALATPAAGIHRAIAVHVIAIEFAVALLILPAANPHLSAREFCAPMRALNKAQEPYDLYSVGMSREEYIYYSERPHTALLTDILPIVIPPDEPNINPIELQIRVKKIVGRAVENVPIADPNNVTPGERKLIEDAIHDALDKEGVSVQLREAFAHAVIDATSALDKATEAGTPALAMMNSKDYRWLLGFVNHIEYYRVIDAGSVGSRNVVLLANPPMLEALAGIGAVPDIGQVHVEPPR